MARKRIHPTQTSNSSKVIFKEQRTNIKGGCNCGKKHKVIRSNVN